MRKIKFLLLGYLSVIATTCFTQTFSNGLPASQDYTVFVNGKKIDVYFSPVPASYVSFDMDAQVNEVEIHTRKSLKWVDIRPLSAGVRPTIQDSIIKFQIHKAANLSIELNGSLQSPLFLFAKTPQKFTDTPKATYVFTGKKRYYIGLLELKDNESVYIEQGSVVVGAIHAKKANNIRIYGGGILDGSYNKVPDEALLLAHTEAKTFRNMKGRSKRFLQFEDCKNVTINDVILHNSTTWQIVPIRSENIHIKNVNIISNQPSDDGIDIVSSKKVLIENCFIRTKDDCIAIKSPAFFGTPLNVEDVRVYKNVLWNSVWGNGMEIGFELDSKEIKNITFENNDLIHIEGGAALSIHNAGKAHVHNILFNDIRIEDARQKLFDVAIFRSQYSPDKPKDAQSNANLYMHGAWDGVIKVPRSDSAYHAGFRGNVSNIVFKNIILQDGIFPFSVFNGFDNRHKVENVTIENLNVNGRTIKTFTEAKVFQEYVNNIKIK